MRFEVYIDEELLFYPNDEAYSINNAVVSLSLNEAGSFECDIPQTNPSFNKISLRKSMIRVLQNESEIFYGEVREETQNFDCTKHIYAVGELAFLFDSIQPQAKYSTSPLEVFKNMLAKHNSQVESRKQFTLGMVTVTDPNDKILRYTNREDTLTAMREKLCDGLDGYLKIRKTGSKRYLDLVTLDDYGTQCMQEIQFGENLLDYTANTSAADIATAVLPLGAKIDEKDRSSDAIEGLDEYVTIKSVNNGSDYISIQKAINTFGMVKVVKKWDDVTKPANLKKKAEAWLKQAQYESLELNVKAIDNNLLDITVDSFDIGDRVNVWAEPYGMENVVFPVREKKIFINDISKNEITLGSKSTKSYTKQSSKAVTEIGEKIPQTSPILENAKKNALKMLNGSEGGHVIFKFDKTDSYLEQMLICDGETEEQSLHEWVWNYAGLGFRYRSKTSEEFNNLSTAITNQGAIVANFITAGILKLSGAIADEGEDKNKKLHLEIYDGKNLIGHWGSDGISISKGAININDKFKVTSSGRMTMTEGTIDLNNGTFKVTNDGKVTIKAGEFNINKGQFKVSDSGKVEINSGTIKINKDQFVVSDKGKVTIKSGTIDINNGVFKITDAGKVSISSGTIGSNKDESKRWQVGDKAIYNGCKSISDSYNNGVYVGTDGFACVKDGAATRITGGIIESNQYISAHSFISNHKNGAVTAPKIVSTSSFTAEDSDGNQYDGITKIITVPANPTGTKYYGINITNGIIIKVSEATAANGATEAAAILAAEAAAQV